MSKKSDEKKKLQNELLDKMENDSGAGMEGADGGCFAVNYLTVLQDMSPQVKARDPLFIKGAEPGMIFCAATGEVFDGDGGVEIVQVGFEHLVNIWKKDRGGFMGRMDINDQRYLKATSGAEGTSDEFKKFDESGNELVDTRNHFLFLLKDGGMEPVVLSCSKSKIKTSTKFMSKLRGIKIERRDGSGKFNPPTFSFSYRLRTYLDKNNKGDEFYNFTVPEMERQVVDPELYEESRIANKQIADGTMQSALPAHDEGM